MTRARLLAVALLLSLLFCACAAPTVTAPPDTALVTRVIDGDTITIEGGYRVRYIGVDTPEISPEPEAFALEALEANRALVGGKVVRLERDTSETDRYGRLLRYVYTGATLVNAELVRRGLAEAVAYPPDTKYQQELERLEQESREAGRGMWGK